MFLNCEAAKNATEAKAKNFDKPFVTRIVNEKFFETNKKSHNVNLCSHVQ